MNAGDLLPGCRGTKPAGYAFRQGPLVCDRQGLWDLSELPGGIASATDLWSVPENTSFTLTGTGKPRIGEALPLEEGLLERLKPSRWGRDATWRGVMRAGSMFDVMELWDSAGESHLLATRWRAVWAHAVASGSFAWVFDEPGNLGRPMRVHLVNTSGERRWVGTIMLTSPRWESAV